MVMASFRNLSYQDSPNLRKNRFRSNVSSRSSLGSPFDVSLWKSSFLSSKRYSLNQSFQSLQVISQTPNYTAESYGVILPVLVTEALTTSERHATISVKMTDSGWAWLVCGRRLFVWKYVYQQSDKSRNNVTYCRELMLPPSDLAHKTELVNILLTSSTQAPSALAVSPEGIVRYWANIAHEGASFEMAIDLQGQECFSLSNTSPLGCILATTTSSLVHLVPTTVDGQNTVYCRTLRMPHGMLAGIGRRVSSFIFGTMPNQSSECKQLSRVLCEDGNVEEEKFIYVLIGNSLQKWQLMGIDSENLICDIDLEQSFTQAFASFSESQTATAYSGPKARAVDVQLAGNGWVLFLVEWSNVELNQIQYAFARVEPSGKLSSFCILQQSIKLNGEDERNHPPYQLLYADPSSQVAYVYNDHTILCASVTTGEVETISFTSIRETILGAGTFQNLALFFINTHGIISVARTDSLVPVNTSFMLDSTFEESITETQSDGVQKLKTALVSFFKNNIVESQILVDDFLQNTEHVPCVDSVLDLSVEKLNRMMIDDHPASDPRWAESVPSDLNDSATSSVIVLHQLADKLRAHELLLKFLKSTGLWEKLYMVRVHNQSMSTAMLVRENAEKLKTAMTLKSLESRYGKIIDAAIQRATSKRTIPRNLTAKDLFYQEVSAVQTIFPALFEVEQELLSKDTCIIETLSNVNAVFLELVRAVSNYRQTISDAYNHENVSVDNGPWTSSHSLQSVFKDQHRLTAEYVSEDTFGALSQQLLELTDSILDSYRHQLDSLVFPAKEYSEAEQEYLRERNRLLHVLMEKGQLEQAASLGEKYYDFGVLVEVCDQTDNNERLQRYMIQFSEQNFASYAFKWYFDEGKRGKLLSFTKQPELTNFLANHDSLSWLHQFEIEDFSSAYNTLKSLALQEKKFASKKKTLFSLAKLSALVSRIPDVEEEINDINTEQDLLLYQETLPARLLDAYGLEPDSMRVLSPEALVEMYISEENADANEYDFKKALDLAHNDESLRFHVWCQAILRDSWNDMDTDEPLESLRNTLFFRIIDLAFTQNVDMQTFLPPVDDILQSEELGSLGHNPSFAFLITAGYEYLQRLLG